MGARGGGEGGDEKITFDNFDFDLKKKKICKTQKVRKNQKKGQEIIFKNKIN